MRAGGKIAPAAAEDHLRYGMLCIEVRSRIHARRRTRAVAGLSLTFWPNPVYRNHPAEKRWYFSVAVREVAAQPVHVMQYHGEWYDMDGRLLDTKEERLDMRLGPLQHLSYADLWVTSAVTHFRYRLVLIGRDIHNRAVSAEGVLLCQ
jgi:hypothetical protein